MKGILQFIGLVTVFAVYGLCFKYVGYRDGYQKGRDDQRKASLRAPDHWRN